MWLLRHPLPEPRLVQDEEDVRRDERRDGRQEGGTEKGPHRAAVEVELGDDRLVLCAREYRAAAAGADQRYVGVAHEGGDVLLVDVENCADALGWEFGFVSRSTGVAARVVADEQRENRFGEPCGCRKRVAGLERRVRPGQASPARVGG